MTQLPRICVLLLLFAIGATLPAQVQNDFLGNHWLTLPGPGIGGLTVGNASGTFGSAFAIRGDLMGTPTGEVFQTRTATANNCFWRMYKGSANIGTLFYLSTGAGEDFFVHANEGNLHFMTDSVDRGRFSFAYTNQTVNSIGGLDLSGYFGVGRFAGGLGGFSKPVTRIHSDRSGQTQVGFRGAMADGLLFTRAFELHYSGLLGAGDAGTVWSRETNSLGTPSPYRFVYTGYHGTPSDAYGANGLEIARFQPETTLNEGYFGIGDWLSAGVLPVDRLDVLDGDVRIRDLPLAANQQPLLDRFVVVDPATGELRWRYSAGVAGCDWFVDGVGFDVTTAWDPSAPAGCPDNTWKVGIGTDAPQGNTKVHVKDNDHLPDYDEAALMVEMDGDADKSVGAFVETNRLASTCQESWGLHALAYNGRDYNAGVRGHVELETGRGSSGTNSVGTRGAVHIATESNDVFGSEGYVQIKNDCALRRAIGNLGWIVKDPAGSNGVVNESYGVLGRTYVGETQYGVYGKVDQPNGPSPIASYGVYGIEQAGGSGAAVYAAGDLVYTNALISSDAMFKTNVQPVTGASAKLMQILPRSYVTDSANFGHVGMDGEEHMGVIAQEIQAVLPELVRTITHPAEYDSTGVLLHPSLQYQAVNYGELIPLLIAGFKEQQVQLAAMQQALAACCVGAPTDGQLLQGQGNSTGTGTQDLSRMSSEDLLTIAPNPFEDRTTISYRNTAPGRVMLRVSDGRGQHIDTLRDAVQDAGAYTYEWNTVDLAPGMYTVSLLLDGQLLVERAVKVGR